jgi:glutaconyl-CoA/methylmalonyl-CoA decarboxylase subunit delta
MARLLLLLLLSFLPCMAFIKNNDFEKIVSVSILGYLIVLLALFCIYLFIFAMTKFVKAAGVYRRKLREQKAKLNPKSLKIVNGGASPEAVTAILMALHLSSIHREEEEKAILTINKLAKTYSPWSSKIYNMRTVPWTTRQ